MVDKTSPENTYQYRGCTITTKKGDNCTILSIDGKEVQCHETESGVTSDDAMYMEFSSTQHLAEHLIKQWGIAKIDRTTGSEDHNHNNHK